MQALILAAGYGTRLYPLTQTVAKPLLPLAGRPMLDYLLDRIREVDEIEVVHVVTNHKFAASFLEWAGSRDVQVHDDGTTSEEDRLGAIGDIQFVVDRAGLGNQDLLVVAGDNLFDYSLADFVRWWHGKDEASAVVLYDVGSLELAARYGIVEVDENDRLLSFVEKPEQPRSTLASTAAYVYHREHVPLIRRYLDEGNVPDQPGRLLEWLVPRVPVYGYTAGGNWSDIGDAGQLLEADNRLRELAGLPLRDVYSLHPDG
ncbi:MAG: glucose-phosphate thymidylyltransferase [Gaiellaceae bacterium]|jgi:glucose-1-phosphate thymidylyltransferase|nr:glucose-phosphate thymidylyltransferase [Gaiellaceae bacterium]